MFWHASIIFHTEGRIGKTYIRGENCLFYGNDTLVNPAKYIRISLDEMAKYIYRYKFLPHISDLNTKAIIRVKKCKNVT